jgi:hypothetical protein
MAGSREHEINIRIPRGTGISLLAEKLLHSQDRSVAYLANYLIIYPLLHCYQLETRDINMCKSSTVHLCQFTRYGK